MRAERLIFGCCICLLALAAEASIPVAQGVTCSYRGKEISGSLIRAELYALMMAEDQEPGSLSPQMESVLEPYRSDLTGDLKTRQANICRWIRAIDQDGHTKYLAASRKILRTKAERSPGGDGEKEPTAEETKQREMVGFLLVFLSVAGAIASRRLFKSDEVDDGNNLS